MSPDTATRLVRIDLSNGKPSAVTTVAEGPALDMVTVAVASASGDLWRYAVQAAGGVTLLPDEIVRLHREWGTLPRGSSSLTCTSRAAQKQSESRPRAET